MNAIEKRIADERKVITVLIRVAKAHGYKLTRVWDGEENQYPRCEKDALDVVFSVDECTMRFKHPEQPKSHGAVVILGNSAWECIADSSVGEGWDEVMSVMDEYTDKMQEQA